MADKEPRRRRKKKDAPRKEEPLLTDLFSGEAHSLSTHTKEAEQELEEDHVAAHGDHEPSKLAQTIFIVLFVLLSVIMGSVFFTLHKSPGKFLRSDIDALDSSSFDVIDHTSLEDAVVLETPSEILDDIENFIDIEEKIVAPESYEELEPSPVVESSDQKLEADISDDQEESVFQPSLSDFSFQYSTVDDFSTSEAIAYNSDDLQTEQPSEVFASSDEAQSDAVNAHVSDLRGDEVVENAFITEAADIEEELLETHSVEDESFIKTVNDEFDVSTQDYDINPSIVVSHKASDDPDPADVSITKTHSEETASIFIPETPSEDPENLELPVASKDPEEDILSIDTPSMETTHLKHSKDPDELMMEELNEIDAILRKENDEEEDEEEDEFDFWKF